MNCQLIRNPELARPDGIFGEMLDQNGNEICVTLEHAYSDGSGGWIAKVAPGTYTCIRGVHTLGSGEKIETFMLQDVPDFQDQPVKGILIHPGNFDDCSEGCTCTGDDYALEADKKTEMITNSRKAFKRFMATQDGVDQFLLVVS